MLKGKITYLVFILSLSGFGFTACSGTKKSNVDLSKSPYFELMEEIQDLTKSDQVNLYRYSEEGEEEKKEKSYVKIDSLNSEEAFRYVEVYNFFSLNGKKEYYISEFRANLSDTIKRYKVLDFQLVVEADSLYVSEGSEYEIRFENKTSLELDGNQYDLYLLSGYAHPGDPNPDQYKIWSPQLGMVLVWYGEERWFELDKSIWEKKAQNLDALKEKSREMILEKK